jgi:tRNA threonylcarbamoyladenosine biosynthesis protein TsaB
VTSPILAIDTTSEFGSIALVQRDGTAFEVPLRSSDGFGHIIYDQIERLLKRQDVSVAEIACFAAGSGPGSFTGVRVGLTVAKGLAEMTGKRVVAASNLQALAWFGSAELRATVLDARRGEVYGAIYDRDLKLWAPEVVAKFQDWIKTVPGENVELISDNPAPFTPFLRQIPIVTAPRALAAAIGQIAWKQFEAGESSDPADVDANYVRRSDAELFWHG